MENNKRDTAQNAAPQTDRQNAETNGLLNADPVQYSGASADNVARTTEEVDERLNAAPRDKEEEDDEETEDEEEDTEEEEEDDDNAGDWGHIDPAEGNGPFPDPNAPSAPGSAV